MVGMVEIELDRYTGEVKILNYVAVVDCGIAINPALARIQAEGGIVQGIGHTLLRISHMMKPENRLSPILCNIKSQRGWTWDTYRLSLRIATSRQVHLAQNPSEKS